MAESMRPRVTDLIAQIKALADVRDLVLVAKAATQQLAMTNAKFVRSRDDEVGARVEIVDFHDRKLDGLTATITAIRPPRRGYTHTVIIELDPTSVEVLAQNSGKWRQVLNTGRNKIPIARSNLSRIWE